MKIEIIEMKEHQQLGGTRQSIPLANEMTYPLTKDEFLTIQESLVSDKLTNWESVLLSVFFASFISGIIIFFTGSFTKNSLVDNVETVIVNTTQVIVVIIYFATTIGSLIGYIISKQSKKKTKSTIERLNNKINQHLQDL